MIDFSIQAFDLCIHKNLHWCYITSVHWENEMSNTHASFEMLAYKLTGTCMQWIYTDHMLSNLRIAYIQWQVKKAWPKLRSTSKIHSPCFEPTSIFILFLKWNIFYSENHFAFFFYNLNTMHTLIDMLNFKFNHKHF